MSEKNSRGALPYALLILLQSVLYGFGNPLSKIGFESIMVLWCLGIRFFGAAVLMMLLFGRRTVQTLRTVPVRAWLPCSLAMAALVFPERSLPGIDPVSMAAAQTTVTGVLCLTAVCAFLLLRERLTAVGLLGAAIILAFVVAENRQSGRERT